MKFSICGTCLKNARGDDIDKNICMLCKAGEYYESCIAKTAEPKKVYVTTAEQHSKYFDNQLLAYITSDVNSTRQIHEWYRHNVGFRYSMPKIKDVIFNPPATIVFWSDGTKTVVKCQEDDIYDPEKGLAMAISKKALGNKREYYHTFKHWLKKYNRLAEARSAIDIALDNIRETIAKFNNMAPKQKENKNDLS